MIVGRIIQSLLNQRQIIFDGNSSHCRRGETRGCLEKKLVCPVVGRDFGSMTSVGIRAIHVTIPAKPCQIDGRLQSLTFRLCVSAYIW